MRERACVFPELLIVCTELKNLVQWKLFRLALLFCHITPRKKELLRVNFFFFLTLPNTSQAACTDLSRRNRGVVM